jgi:Bacterial capsule synthesis protein PGA_cap
MGCIHAIERVIAPETEHLVFGGDTSLGDFYLSANKWPNEHARLVSAPATFFDGVRGLIGRNDVTILNFESVLLADRTTATPLEKDYPGWDNPKRILPLLQDLNVVGVNLANNHTKDFGPEHLLETMSLFGRQGIVTFGAGENDGEAGLPLRLSYGPKSIYVLGAMQFRQRYKEKLDYYATSSTTGIKLFDEVFIAAIAAIRSADLGALIIASPHWGENYKWANGRTRQLAADIASAGADLVLGHGTHMLGECLATPSGLAIMSLGNFVFNSPGRYRKYSAPPISLVAKLPLTNQLERNNIQLYLYPIVTDNRLTGFRPRSVSTKECLDVYDLLKSLSGDGFEFERRFKVSSSDAGPHITLQHTQGNGFKDSH